MSNESSPLNIGERVWNDDPFVRALNLSAELGKVLGDIAASGHAPDENAGRVAELERELADAHEARRQVITRGERAERDLAEARADVARLQELADKTVLAAANRTLQAEHGGELRASAVTAERVVELERQLADAQYNAESFRERAEGTSKAHRAALDRIAELRQLLAQVEQDRDSSDATANECDGEREELRQALDLLATAYVVREVPWRDVAAGMMTISSQGVPFLAESVGGDPKLEIGLRGLHDGKVIRFEKAPAAGETVRVLVPYVTPEQAESLVKNGLGGTAVS